MFVDVSESTKQKERQRKFIKHREINSLQPADHKNLILILLVFIDTFVIF